MTHPDSDLRRSTLESTSVQIGPVVLRACSPMFLRIYPAGPALVRGAEEIWGEGSEIECRRATIAICRCGASRLGVLCDGTHRFVGEQSFAEVLDVSDEPAAEVTPASGGPAAA